jgi:hypothetical protein
MSTYAGDAIAAVGAEDMFDLTSPTRTAYSAAGTVRLLALSIGLGVVVILASTVNGYGKKHLAAIDRAATAAQARSAMSPDNAAARDLEKASDLLVLLRNELVSLLIYPILPLL